MSRTLRLFVCEVDGNRVPVDVEIDQVVLVGYTGRDRAGVWAHIRELEALGVAPPPRVPAIYVVSPGLVTTSTRLSVPHGETSGEAEFFVVNSPLGTLVGVGSDHTDRRHEAIDIAESKSLCDKVISPEVWRLRDVADHWDALELGAWTGDRQVYQAGRLVELLPVADVLAEVAAAELATERSMVFGGTLPTMGGFVYADRFEVALHDPRLARRLSQSYAVTLQQ